MPSPPAYAATPSRMLHELDTALDQSQDIKADVEACAEVAGEATTLPAAQALRNGPAVELRPHRFKLVNDTHGHAAGDAVLKVVAERLMRHARSPMPTPHVSGQAASKSLRALRAVDGFERGFGAADGLNRMTQSRSPTPPESVATLGTVIKVLAVDDDDFMRDLLDRVLAGAGMHVASYGSAAEMLDSGELASATVLLLDVKMPGMSGLGLQDLLRRRGIELPVVFISGAADLAMAVTAMRNGAADFIEKPFQGALLIERVRLAVARHADRVATSQRLADPLVLPRFETLTPREREVFDLLVTGLSSKLIARELGGSFRTIEIHRAQVMRKMAARHLPDLVRMSIESMAPRRVGTR